MTVRISVRKIAGFAIAGLLLAACSQQPKDVESVAPSVVPGSAEDFEANVANTVYFGFDRQDLTSEAAEILSRVKDWLATYTSRNLVVEGHADKRGTKEYNLALGSRRAESVKKFLVSNGIDESRLKTVSFGKEALADLGDDEMAHARNRRAHLVVAE